MVGGMPCMLRSKCIGFPSEPRIGEAVGCGAVVAIISKVEIRQ